MPAPALAPRRRTRMAAAIAIALASATASHAAVPCTLCTCVVPEYQMPAEAVMEAFYAADAVFLGEVVEIGTDSGIECLQVAGCRDPDPDPAADPFAARVIVGFRVETALKGVGEEAAEIEVATHHQGTACGYMFQVGRSYLVYASDRGEDGRLSTNHCTRTRPVEDAAFDIGVLSR